MLAPNLSIEVYQRMYEYTCINIYKNIHKVLEYWSKFWWSTLTYIGFKLIHSIKLPRIWIQKKTYQILLIYNEYNNPFLPFLCAYFPGKLGAQTKKESWNPQYKQCNLANHTDYAYNNCFQNQEYHDRECPCQMVSYAVILLSV